MNRVVLVGRLARDPEIKYSQADPSMAIARYTLAVDRRGAKKDGQQTADFISCIAFGKAGEFAEKYLHKGMKIAVSGHIQTGSYTKQDGTKVYTTDVVLDAQEFCESKQSADNATAQQSGIDGFMQIPDGIDEALPFN